MLATSGCAAAAPPIRSRATTRAARIRALRVPRAEKAREPYLGPTRPADIRKIRYTRSAAREFCDPKSPGHAQVEGGLPTPLTSRRHPLLGSGQLGRVVPLCRRKDRGSLGAIASVVPSHTIRSVTSRKSVLIAASASSSPRGARWIPSPNVESAPVPAGGRVSSASRK